MRSLALSASGGIVAVNTAASTAVGDRDVLVEVSQCHVDHERTLECAKGPVASLWPVSGMPAPLGWECLGKVLATGSLVTRCRPGDTVLGLAGSGAGACASQVTLDEGSVVVKPSKIDGAVALASLAPGVLAYSVLHYKMRARRGDVVLLAGPVDECAALFVQLACLAGALVVLLVPVHPSEGKDRGEGEGEGEGEGAGAGTAECARLRAQFASDATTLIFHDPAALDVDDTRRRLLAECSDLGFDHIFDNNTTARAPGREGGEDGDGDEIGNRDGDEIGDRDGDGDGGGDGDEEKMKELLLRSLAPHGSLVTRRSCFEVDARASLQLWLRGASVCFVSVLPWLLSGARRSQLLHVIEDLLLQLDRGAIHAEVPRQVAFDEACGKQAAELLAGSSLNVLL